MSFVPDVLISHLRCNHLRFLLVEHLIFTFHARYLQSFSVHITNVPLTTHPHITVDPAKIGLLRHDSSHASFAARWPSASKSAQVL